MGDVLFSPVGTADPLTLLGDGPMLHIIRNYRPDAVLLLISTELAKHESQDHRYSDSIKRIAPDAEIRIVESQVAEIYKYDAVVPEFSALVQQLADEFPDDRIILNASSGTPAMKAALVALSAFGVPPTTAIQVTTPRAGLNQRDDREPPTDYDLEALWELNPDNSSGAKNRCLEVESPALGVLLQRENIKKLILAYDYKAAKTLSGKALLPQKTNEMITGAMYRIRHNLAKAESNFLGTPFRIRSRSDYLREAVSVLNPLVRQDSLPDFVRSLTPIVSEVVATRPEVKQRELPEGFYDQYNLLDSQHKEMLRPFEQLHRRLRNPAAHDLKGGSITAEEIKRVSGKTPRQLVSLLCDLTNANADLYDQINAEIIRQIDGAPLHL